MRERRSRRRCSPTFAIAWPTMDYDRLRWSDRRSWSAEPPRRSPALGIEALTLAHRPPLSRPGQEAQFGAHHPPRRIGADLPAAAALRRRRAAGTPRCRHQPGQTREQLRGPQADETTLLIDARGFPPEGEDCDATLAVKAYRPRLAAHRSITTPAARGSTAWASVPAPTGLRIDCYDNPGDYLGSGMDGLEIYVHGNAQDQLCQIAKRASWWSTATWARRSCTAPRAAISTCWATPPAGR